MKKIILFLIICLFITGCYDNIELNDLSIINGIGIDYKNDNFYITYEILNDTKTSNNEVLKSYTKTGHGKTINEAFINTNYKISKKSYFAHLKLTIISESIAKSHLTEIVDYFLRDPNIRDEFILLISKDSHPEDILNSASDDTPNVTSSIIELLENDSYNNNTISLNEPYEKIISKLINKNYDITINSITFENNIIELSNNGIFKNNELYSYLSKKDSTLYNLLTNKNAKYTPEKKYEDKTVAVNVYDAKKDIKVTKDLIDITINCEGKILENNKEFNLIKTETFKKLNKDFSKILETEIKNFIKTLQDNESDILGLQEIYYKKYRKNNKKLWKNANIKVHVNLIINRKGFTYEVKDEK